MGQIEVEDSQLRKREKDWEKGEKPKERLDPQEYPCPSYFTSIHLNMEALIPGSEPASFSESSYS